MICKQTDRQTDRHTYSSQNFSQNFCHPGSEITIINQTFTCNSVPECHRQWRDISQVCPCVTRTWLLIVDVPCCQRTRSGNGPLTGRGRTQTRASAIQCERGMTVNVHVMWQAKFREESNNRKIEKLTKKQGWLCRSVSSTSTLGAWVSEGGGSHWEKNLSVICSNTPFLTKQQNKIIKFSSLQVSSYTEQKFRVERKWGQTSNWGGRGLPCTFSHYTAHSSNESHLS